MVLPDNKAIVEGVVLNALTNEPLRRASVTLRAKKNYTLVTSAEGKFRFEALATFGQLAPGEYRIAAWEKVDYEYLNLPEFRDRFDAQKIQVKPIPKSASDAEIAKLQ